MTEPVLDNRLVGYGPPEDSLVWDVFFHDDNQQLNLSVSALQFQKCKISADIEKKSITKDTLTDDMLDHHLEIKGKMRTPKYIHIKIKRTGPREFLCDYLVRYNVMWLFSTQAMGQVALSDGGVAIRAKTKDDVQAYLESNYNMSEISVEWSEIPWGQEARIYRIT